MTLPERFGRTVRRLREEAGYSQEAFADRAKVHRTYMGTVERGETNLTLENIEKLARALGMKMWQLLKEMDDG
jgi:transcriptional regulator with XRE-family HTH domain